MFIFSIFIFVTYLFVQVLASCDWPNGTDKALHWYQDPSHLLTVYSLTTKNINGNTDYPIHLSYQLVAILNATNSAGPITHIQEDVYLSGWDPIFCKWNEIPTFGQLNNLDGCQSGIDCPIPTGNQLLKITIDFTRFQAIVNLLKNDAPYQLQIMLTNKLNGDKIVVTAQARAVIQ